MKEYYDKAFEEMKAENTAHNKGPFGRVPLHFVPRVLLSMVIRVGNKCLDVCNYHATVKGWTGVLKCKVTGQEYRIDLTPIRSKVKVGLMADDVIQEGGFHDFSDK